MRSLLSQMWGFGPGSAATRKRKRPGSAGGSAAKRSANADNAVDSDSANGGAPDEPMDDVSDVSGAAAAGIGAGGGANGDAVMSTSANDDAVIVYGTDRSDSSDTSDDDESSADDGYEGAQPNAVLTANSADKRDADGDACMTVPPAHTRRAATAPSRSIGAVAAALNSSDVLSLTMRLLPFDN
jgi:hypothetical protein